MSTKKKSFAFSNKKGVKLAKKNVKQPDIYKVPFSKLVYSSIAINALSALVIIYFQKRLPPQVPLFYGLAEGEDQLTQAVYLMLLPITSFTLLGLNIGISMLLKNDLLRKTLIITGFIVSMFSLITLTQIFFLVGPF